jgi:PPOX class probable F420-dependent enzyme
MPAQIPDAYRDLLDRPIVITLVTVMPNGQPQATPVWCSYDGTHVLVNIVRGRQKDKNMQRDPRVTILAVDPNNPFRWIEVRGRVVENTEQGALEHINRLAKLYVNRDDYYAPRPEMRGQETRVIYKIRPERVNVKG